jgi:adenosylcobinamide-phosphate guanylyltransferase
MIGLVLAGGKGTRMQLDHEEKLLLNYKKKSVILHVIDALKNSNCFEKIIALTSPNSPKTEKILKEYGIETISSSGHDLVSDMNEMLVQLDDFVFVTSGDLPLLDSEIVKKIVERSHNDKIWNSIVTTGSFQKSLGTSLGYTVKDSDIENNPGNLFVQTGINVVDAKKNH